MVSIRKIKVPVTFKLKIPRDKLRTELLAGLSEFVGRKNTKALQNQLADKALEILDMYLVPVIEKPTVKKLRNVKK